MAQIAAFGRDTSTDHGGGLEAILGELRKAYESALQSDAAGDADAAELQYQAVIDHELVNAQTSDIPKSASTFKILALKNLGALHIKKNRLISGLNCYVVAAQIGDNGWNESSLLIKIGECARRLDLLSLARQCFERCLIICPQDENAIANLLEVLSESGDNEGFARLSQYGNFCVASKWSGRAVSLEENWANHSNDFVAVKRRRYCEGPNVVQSRDLLWSSETHLCFGGLVDFLLEKFALLSAQRQPTEALTAPITIQIEARMHDDEPSLPDAGSPLAAGSSQVSVHSHLQNESSNSDSLVHLSPSKSQCSNDSEDSSQCKASLSAFLHKILPRLRVRLDSSGIVFETLTEPPQSENPSDRNDSVPSYEEDVDVLSFINLVSGQNSGLISVLSTLWVFISIHQPNSLSPDQMRSISDTLSKYSSGICSRIGMLLEAELLLDQIHSNPSSRELPQLVKMHQLMQSLSNTNITDGALNVANMSKADDRDFIIRHLWLSALWHIHFNDRINAMADLNYCLELMSEMPTSSTISRYNCRFDNSISVEIIGKKLLLLRVWELCENAIFGDTDSIPSLTEAIMKEECVLQHVPPAMQLQALRVLYDYHLSKEADSVLLLSLRCHLLLAYSPSIETPVSELSLFDRCLSEYINEARDLRIPSSLSDSLTMAVIRALANSLSYIIQIGAQEEYLSNITLALVLTICLFDPVIALSPYSQLEILNACHIFLASFKLCCSRDYLFLRNVLNVFLYNDTFAEDLSDESLRLFHIGSCYSCIYGLTDPRHECHDREGIVNLTGRQLPPDEPLRLLEYCERNRALIIDLNDLSDFDLRILPLLRQLRSLIGIPTDLMPSCDYISSFLNDESAQDGRMLPLVGHYSGDIRLYGRYYDFYAQLLTDSHSLCSFSSRVPAAAIVDLTTASDLLQIDLRLHPNRIRSWYRLAWAFIHQKIAFIAGVESTILELSPVATSDEPVSQQTRNDSTERFSQYFAPIFKARRCFLRTLFLLKNCSEDVPELNLIHRPDPCINQQKVLEDLLVIELRLLEFVFRFNTLGVSSSALLVQFNVSCELQANRVQSILDKIPSTPRMCYISALVHQYRFGIDASNEGQTSEILRLYDSASVTIPDALYCKQVILMKFLNHNQSTNGRLFIQTYLESPLEDYETPMGKCISTIVQCFLDDPEFFRPALRLAEVVLSGRHDLANQAVSQLSSFINDKSRVRRIRFRKGSLSPTATDSEFVRALIFDPKLDTAEEDCLLASLLLCRILGNWEELESIYNNVVRPRRDKRVSLIYASALVGALIDWSDTLGQDARYDMRESLFKRSFECCLDLMRGKRGTQSFVPALVVLPYRIVHIGQDNSKEISLSGSVDFEEIRQARDWCSEQQFARSMRQSLQRMNVPPRIYGLNDHVLTLNGVFNSFRFHL
uniref:Uncharacterized protein n=1 Tax=Spongospora subterranea TaxID=70186 RepID=A0A0H5QP57_9EUKA|eukprot:CRZ03387.1 hypothetical protein [Spongospora subterranea]